MKRKPVKHLKVICLEKLGPMFTKHIRRLVSKASAAKWFGLLHGQIDLIDSEAVIQRQIERLRDFIWSYVSWYDYLDFFTMVINSLEEAIRVTRTSWNPSLNMAQYKEEMEHLVCFVDIALHRQLKHLDFSTIPNSVRSRVLEKLHELKNIEQLVVRSFNNSGSQWLFKSVAKDLIKGLSCMSGLRKFSLKHDCNDAIIECLSKHCWMTLSVLDVESSKQVTDASIGRILSCQSISELNIFNTGMSDEGKSRLIAHLPMLTHLPRGDFLCEALGWIEDEDPVYLIKEFFPSQSYFFHEDWQMDMVAKCCPFISRMFFIFHEKYVPDFLILAPFLHLTELELYGGRFYADKLPELLLIRGQALTRLTLMSVRDIDYRAFALLSVHCKKLKHLTLTNCALADYKPSGDPNSDEEYERRQAFIEMAKEAYETVETFPDLESFSLNCFAGSLYVVFILSRCPALKIINIGSHNELTDEAMLKVLIQNPMERLEEFHCDKSQHLTMMTVNLLANNCQNLKAVSDLQNWHSVGPLELSKFRESVRVGNFELDTSSHQRLRKFLTMREFEKRTYINLIAGPSIERLRIADRELQGI